MEQLEIVIKGRAKSGKSSMAAFLAHSLIKQGCYPAMYDQDTLAIPLSEVHKRLTSLRPTVAIKTEMVGRQSSHALLGAIARGEAELRDREVAAGEALHERARAPSLKEADLLPVLLQGYEREYGAAFESLKMMRLAHPTCRDDVLLMRLICGMIKGDV